MKPKLNLLTFASPLHNQSELFGSKREILNVLKSAYDLVVTEGNVNIQPSLPYIVFVGTGGTERQVLSRLANLPKPMIVLSDSYHNSLAASLEISSKLYNDGVPHWHINFSQAATPELTERMLQEAAACISWQKASIALAEVRIGLIGGESDWLIASGIDKEQVQKRSGATFVDIPISKIMERFASIGEQTMPDSLTSKLCKSRSEEDVKQALKMYAVLDELCSEEKLSAITIKCFDLLKPCNTTACLALSMLNDKGIVAGCEGDIPSVWSMILSKLLCDTTSFMANPSAIDRSDCSIDFAHCTVPVSLAKSYTLPTHYESNMGIAVAAKLALGAYTLFKCGGKQLDKYCVFEGELVQNTSVVERCRTQVKFRFNSEDEIDSFLQSHLGNHVILIPGHHAAKIEAFLKK